MEPTENENVSFTSKETKNKISRKNSTGATKPKEPKKAIKNLDTKAAAGTTVTPGETVTKYSSPSKSTAELKSEDKSPIKETATAKTVNKSSVVRRSSSKGKTKKTSQKPTISQVINTNSDKKKQEESNLHKTDTNVPVTQGNETKDSLIKVRGNKTDLKLNEDTTNSREATCNVSSVKKEETQIEKRTEKKTTDINTKDKEEDESPFGTVKKSPPKAGVTISDLIDDAVKSFEEEDYMKCIVACEEILNTDWTDMSDQEKFSLAFLYIGKSYEKLDELEKALAHYRFSVAVWNNLSVSVHIAEVEQKLKEKEKVLAEDENRKGNDALKAKRFHVALQHYTQAIKKNPEQAKYFSNRSVCYLKLKEYLLALSDAQNSIRIDPKSVKGYFREGAAYTALNKPSKACTSYSTILQIDPDNEDAKKHYSKSTEKAKLDPNDPEAVKKRIEEEPELIQILNDRQVRKFLGEMEHDPTAVRKYMQDISVRKKIQKLLECGLLNASGPHNLFSVD